MKRLALPILAVLFCASAAQKLHAQAAPTATRNGRLQVGAGISIANPDYAPHYIKGFSVWGDLDLFNHIGVEATIHKISYFTPADVGEDSYLIGPRYVFHVQKFDPYVKALFGIGRFQRQFDTSPHTTETHGAYSFGGGVDYRASTHYTVRGDFEAQQWPAFKPNGLTPYVVTLGVGYAF